MIKAESLSRNVQFDFTSTNPHLMSTKHSDAIYGLSQAQTPYNAYSRNQHQPRNCSSALEVHKPILFFQDKDYFEVQKTWELKKLPEASASKRKSMKSASRNHGTGTSQMVKGTRRTTERPEVVMTNLDD